jgi:hypothetical protein
LIEEKENYFHLKKNKRLEVLCPAPFEGSPGQGVEAIMTPENERPPAISEKFSATHRRATYNFLCHMELDRLRKVRAMTRRYTKA